MRSYLKSVLALALVACGASLSAPAEASGIEPKTLNGDLRSFNFSIEAYHMSSVNGFAAQTATITPALAVGADGLIYNRDMNGVTAFVAGSTDTFGAIPYPAKLFVSIFDAGNACGCTNGTIWGIDPAGNPISETIANLYTTAGYTTTHAFEQVTRVSFPAGKCGGGGAFDRFIIAVGTAVALPYRIRSISQIMSVCQFDAGHDGIANHNERCAPGQSGAAVTTTGFVFDATANTLDVSGAYLAFGNGTSTGPNRTRLTFRGRASNY